MAHYASDCWDAEIETSYGWIEVAGHADRSCYDLEVHSKATNTDLNAARPLDTPFEKKEIFVSANKKVLGKALKKNSKPFFDHLEAMTDDDKYALKERIEATEGETVPFDLNGEVVEIEKEHINITENTKMVMEEKFTPNVIEPSFGIGRLIYCIFEHCFNAREADEKRTYFAFPPLVAPVKASILPLASHDPNLSKVVRELSKSV